jgi:head-tail adaptor
MPDNPSGALAASTGVGSLRWLVTLYRRDQAPADDMALQETLVPIATVHADIQPTYASTFYQSTQVDTPVTHMINIRWQDYPVTIDVVVRSTRRPDNGGLRSELFRVRRTKEVGGRKRFLQMECELEHSRFTPDDSDATRNGLLTEPYSGNITTWDSTRDAPPPVSGTLWDLGTPPPP